MSEAKLKSFTNADMIRHMSDEELADFIAMQRFSAVNSIADALGIDVMTAFIVGRRNALDWLKQKVESDTELKLKPCPFCGWPAVFEPFEERKGYAATVRCSGCAAEITTITYDTEKEAETHALRQWNRRVKEDEN